MEPTLPDTLPSTLSLIRDGGVIAVLVIWIWSLLTGRLVPITLVKPLNDLAAHLGQMADAYTRLVVTLEGGSATAFNGDRLKMRAMEQRSER
jgi:hypothetical protein